MILIVDGGKIPTLHSDSLLPPNWLMLVLCARALDHIANPQQSLCAYNLIV